MTPQSDFRGYPDARTEANDDQEAHHGSEEAHDGQPSDGAHASEAGQPVAGEAPRQACLEVLADGTMSPSPSAQPESAAVGPDHFGEPVYHYDEPLEEATYGIPSEWERVDVRAADLTLSGWESRVGDQTYTMTVGAIGDHVKNKPTRYDLYVKTSDDDPDSRGTRLPSIYAPELGAAQAEAAQFISGHAASTYKPAPAPEPVSEGQQRLNEYTEQRLAEIDAEDEAAALDRMRDAAAEAERAYDLAKLEEWKAGKGVDLRGSWELGRRYQLAQGDYEEEVDRRYQDWLEGGDSTLGPGHIEVLRRRAEDKVQAALDSIVNDEEAYKQAEALDEAEEAVGYLDKLTEKMDDASIDALVAQRDEMRSQDISGPRITEPEAMRPSPATVVVDLPAPAPRRATRRSDRPAASKPKKVAAAKGGAHIVLVNGGVSPTRVAHPMASRRR